MEKDHPLLALNGRRVGHYRTNIECNPLRSRQGWTLFSLYLEDQRGRVSSQEGPDGKWMPAAVLQGIYSRGGRGVIGWIEVGAYQPVVHFEGPGHPSETLVLSENEIDQKVFNLVSEVIPPGGHFMFVYEVHYESSFHQETEEGLRRGIPPVSTPQGTLLFHCGCRWVKNWYLAEGGHEGLRKLWGEKPLNEKELLRFDLLTFFQILSFLSRRPNPEFLELESKARKRTRGILSELRIESTLSVLRDKLIAIYPDDLDTGAMEQASRHCCQLIHDDKAFQFEDSWIREELGRVSKECLEVSSMNRDDGLSRK
jgi:hypothetical protein